MFTAADLLALVITSLGRWLVHYIITLDNELQMNYSNISPKYCMKKSSMKILLNYYFLCYMEKANLLRVKQHKEE